STYWTHELYRGPHGEKVKVEYCCTKEHSERVAKKFLGKSVLGFDMEWMAPILTRKRVRTLKDEISLIQLASDDHIALFHIARHHGDTADDLICDTLRHILVNPNVIKTGVGCYRADATRLKSHFDIEARGLIELYNLQNVAFDFPSHDTRTSFPKSLADMVKLHLKLPLCKGDVRISSWIRPLTDAQVCYAAADAYAGLMLFRTLDKKRYDIKPVPP
ncbi:ribonuclease H-like protein, partial [Aulographum hederae CBS 113979]